MGKVSKGLGAHTKGHRQLCTPQVQLPNLNQKFSKGSLRPLTCRQGEWGAGQSWECFQLLMWEELSLLLVWVKPEPEMLYTGGDKMEILDVVGLGRHDSSCRPGRKTQMP